MDRRLFIKEEVNRDDSRLFNQHPKACKLSPTRQLLLKYDSVVSRDVIRIIAETQLRNINETSHVIALQKVSSLRDYVLNLRYELTLLRRTIKDFIVQQHYYPRSKPIFSLLKRYVAVEIEVFARNKTEETLKEVKQNIHELLENFLLDLFFNEDERARSYKTKLYQVRLITESFAEYLFERSYHDKLTRDLIDQIHFMKAVKKLYVNTQVVCIDAFWLNDDLKEITKVDNCDTDSEGETNGWNKEAIAWNNTRKRKGKESPLNLKSIKSKEEKRKYNTIDPVDVIEIDDDSDEDNKDKIDKIEDLTGDEEIPNSIESSGTAKSSDIQNRHFSNLSNLETFQYPTISQNSASLLPKITSSNSEQQIPNVQNTIRKSSTLSFQEKNNQDQESVNVSSCPSNVTVRFDYDVNSLKESSAQVSSTSVCDDVKRIFKETNSVKISDISKDKITDTVASTSTSPVDQITSNLPISASPLDNNSQVISCVVQKSAVDDNVITTSSTVPDSSLENVAQQHIDDSPKIVSANNKNEIYTSRISTLTSEKACNENIVTSNSEPNTLEGEQTYSQDESSQEDPVLTEINKIIDGPPCNLFMESDLLSKIPSPDIKIQSLTELPEVQSVRTLEPSNNIDVKNSVRSSKNENISKENILENQNIELEHPNSIAIVEGAEINKEDGNTFEISKGLQCESKLLTPRDTMLHPNMSDDPLEQHKAADEISLNSAKEVVVKLKVSLEEKGCQQQLFNKNDDVQSSITSKLLNTSTEPRKNIVNQTEEVDKDCQLTNTEATAERIALECCTSETTEISKTFYLPDSLQDPHGASKNIQDAIKYRKGYSENLEDTLKDPQENFFKCLLLDSLRTKRDDSSQTLQVKSTTSLQQDSSRSLHDNFSKTINEESSKSLDLDSSKSLHQDSTNLQEDCSVNPKQDSFKSGHNDKQEKDSKSLQNIQKSEQEYTLERKEGFSKIQDVCSITTLDALEDVKHLSNQKSTSSCDSQIDSNLTKHEDTNIILQNKTSDEPMETNQAIKMDLIKNKHDLISLDKETYTVTEKNSEVVVDNCKDNEISEIKINEVHSEIVKNDFGEGSSLIIENTNTLNTEVDNDEKIDETLESSVLSNEETQSSVDSVKTDAQISDVANLETKISSENSNLKRISINISKTTPILKETENVVNLLQDMQSFQRKSTVPIVPKPAILAETESSDNSAKTKFQHSNLEPVIVKPEGLATTHSKPTSTENTNKETESGMNPAKTKSQFSNFDPASSEVLTTPQSKPISTDMPEDTNKETESKINSAKSKYSNLEVLATPQSKPTDMPEDKKTESTANSAMQCSDLETIPVGIPKPAVLTKTLSTDYSAFEIISTNTETTSLCVNKETETSVQLAKAEVQSSELETESTVIPILETYMSADIPKAEVINSSKNIDEEDVQDVKEETHLIIPIEQSGSSCEKNIVEASVDQETLAKENLENEELDTSQGKDNKLSCESQTHSNLTIHPEEDTNIVLHPDISIEDCTTSNEIVNDDIAAKSSDDVNLIENKSSEYPPSIKKEEESNTKNILKEVAQKENLVNIGIENQIQNDDFNKLEALPNVIAMKKEVTIVEVVKENLNLSDPKLSTTNRTGETTKVDFKSSKQTPIKPEPAHVPYLNDTLDNDNNLRMLSAVACDYLQEKNVKTRSRFKVGGNRMANEKIQKGKLKQKITGKKQKKRGKKLKKQLEDTLENKRMTRSCTRTSSSQSTKTIKPEKSENPDSSKTISANKKYFQTTKLPEKKISEVTNINDESCDSCEGNLIIAEEGVVDKEVTITIPDENPSEQLPILDEVEELSKQQIELLKRNKTNQPIPAPIPDVATAVSKSTMSSDISHGIDIILGYSGPTLDTRQENCINDYAQPSEKSVRTKGQRKSFTKNDTNIDNEHKTISKNTYPSPRASRFKSMECKMENPLKSNSPRRNSTESTDGKKVNTDELPYSVKNLLKGKIGKAVNIDKQEPVPNQMSDLVETKQKQISCSQLIDFKPSKSPKKRWKEGYTSEEKQAEIDPKQNNSVVEISKTTMLEINITSLPQPKSTKEPQSTVSSDVKPNNVKRKKSVYFDETISKNDNIQDNLVEFSDIENKEVSVAAVAIPAVDEIHNLGIPSVTVTNDLKDKKLDCIPSSQAENNDNFKEKIKNSENQLSTKTKTDNKSKNNKIYEKTHIEAKNKKQLAMEPIKNEIKTTNAKLTPDIIPTSKSSELKQIETGILTKNITESSKIIEHDIEKDKKDSLNASKTNRNKENSSNKVEKDEKRKTELQMKGKTNIDDLSSSGKILTASIKRLDKTTKSKSDESIGKSPKSQNIHNNKNKTKVESKLSQRSSRDSHIPTDNNRDSCRSDADKKHKTDERISSRNPAINKSSKELLEVNDVTNTLSISKSPIEKEVKSNAEKKDKKSKVVDAVEKESTSKKSSEVKDKRSKSRSSHTRDVSISDKFKDKSKEDLEVKFKLEDNHRSVKKENLETREYTKSKEEKLLQSRLEDTSKYNKKNIESKEIMRVKLTEKSSSRSSSTDSSVSSERESKSKDKRTKSENKGSRSSSRSSRERSIQKSPRSSTRYYSTSNSRDSTTDRKSNDNTQMDRGSKSKNNINKDEAHVVVTRSRTKDVIRKSRERDYDARHTSRKTEEKHEIKIKGNTNEKSSKAKDKIDSDKLNDQSKKRPIDETKINNENEVLKKRKDDIVTKLQNHLAKGSTDKPQCLPSTDSSKDSKVKDKSVAGGENIDKSQSLPSTASSKDSNVKHKIVSGVENIDKPQSSPSTASSKGSKVKDISISGEEKSRNTGIEEKIRNKSVLGGDIVTKLQNHLAKGNTDKPQCLPSTTSSKDSKVKDKSVSGVENIDKPQSLPSTASSKDSNVKHKIVSGVENIDKPQSSPSTASSKGSKVKDISISGEEKSKNTGIEEKIRDKSVSGVETIDKPQSLPSTACSKDSKVKDKSVSGVENIDKPQSSPSTASSKGSKVKDISISGEEKSKNTGIEEKIKLQEDKLKPVTPKNVNMKEENKKLKTEKHTTNDVAGEVEYKNIETATIKADKVQDNNKLTISVNTTKVSKKEKSKDAVPKQINSSTSKSHDLIDSKCITNAKSDALTDSRIVTSTVETKSDASTDSNISIVEANSEVVIQSNIYTLITEEEQEKLHKKDIPNSSPTTDVSNGMVLEDTKPKRITKDSSPDAPIAQQITNVSTDFKDNPSNKGFVNLISDNLETTEKSGSNQIIPPKQAIEEDKSNEINAEKQLVENIAQTTKSQDINIEQILSTTHNLQKEDSKIPKISNLIAPEVNLAESKNNLKDTFISTQKKELKPKDSINKHSKEFVEGIKNKFLDIKKVDVQQPPIQHSKITEVVKATVTNQEVSTDLNMVSFVDAKAKPQEQLKSTRKDVQRETEGLIKPLIEATSISTSLFCIEPKQQEETKTLDKEVSSKHFSPNNEVKTEVIGKNIESKTNEKDIPKSDQENCKLNQKAKLEETSTSTSACESKPKIQEQIKLSEKESLNYKCTSQNNAIKVEFAENNIETNKNKNVLKNDISKDSKHQVINHNIETKPNAIRTCSSTKDEKIESGLKTNESKEPKLPDWVVQVGKRNATLREKPDYQPKRARKDSEIRKEQCSYKEKSSNFEAIINGLKLQTKIVAEKQDNSNKDVGDNDGNKHCPKTTLGDNIDGNKKSEKTIVGDNDDNTVNSAKTTLGDNNDGIKNSVKTNFVEDKIEVSTDLVGNKNDIDLLTEKNQNKGFDSNIFPEKVCDINNLSDMSSPTDIIEEMVISEIEITHDIKEPISTNICKSSALETIASPVTEMKKSDSGCIGKFVILDVAAETPKITKVPFDQSMKLQDESVLVEDVQTNTVEAISTPKQEILQNKIVDNLVDTSKPLTALEKVPKVIAEPLAQFTEEGAHSRSLFASEIPTPNLMTPIMPLAPQVFETLIQTDVVDKKKEDSELESKQPDIISDRVGIENVIPTCSSGVHMVDSHLLTTMSYVTDLNVGSDSDPQQSSKSNCNSLDADEITLLEKAKALGSIEVNTGVSEMTSVGGPFLCVEDQLMENNLVPMGSGSLENTLVATTNDFFSEQDNQLNFDDFMESNRPQDVCLSEPLYVCKSDTVSEKPTPNEFTNSESSTQLSDFSDNQGKDEVSHTLSIETMQELLSNTFSSFDNLTTNVSNIAQIDQNATKKDLVETDVNDAVYHAVNNKVNILNITQLRQNETLTKKDFIATGANDAVYLTGTNKIPTINVSNIAQQDRNETLINTDLVGTDLNEAVYQAVKTNTTNIGKYNQNETLTNKDFVATNVNDAVYHAVNNKIPKINVLNITQLRQNEAVAKKDFVASDVGDALYLTGNNKIQTINVSNITQPSQNENLNNNVVATDVSDSVYLAGNNKIHTFNVTNIAQPSPNDRLTNKDLVGTDLRDAVYHAADNKTPNNNVSNILKQGLNENLTEKDLGGTDVSDAVYHAVDNILSLKTNKFPLTDWSLADMETVTFSSDTWTQDDIIKMKTVDTITETIAKKTKEELSSKVSSDLLLDIQIKPSLKKQKLEDTSKDGSSKKKKQVVTLVPASAYRAPVTQATHTKPAEDLFVPRLPRTVVRAPTKTVDSTATSSVKETETISKGSSKDSPTILNFINPMKSNKTARKPNKDKSNADNQQKTSLTDDEEDLLPSCIRKRKMNSPPTETQLSELFDKVRRSDVTRVPMPNSSETRDYDKDGKSKKQKSMNELLEDKPQIPLRMPLSTDTRRKRPVQALIDVDELSNNFKREAQNASRNTVREVKPESNPVVQKQINLPDKNRVPEYPTTSRQTRRTADAIAKINANRMVDDMMPIVGSKLNASSLSKQSRSDVDGRSRHPRNDIMDHSRRRESYQDTRCRNHQQISKPRTDGPFYHPYLKPSGRNRYLLETPLSNISLSPAANPPAANHDYLKRLDKIMPLPNVTFSPRRQQGRK